MVRVNFICKMSSLEVTGIITGYPLPMKISDTPSAVTLHCSDCVMFASNV